MTENIFVTGARGVIGTILTEKFLSKKRVTVFDGDIRDKSAICAQLPDELDAVIHLAAVVPVDEVGKDPARSYEVNAAGTLNLVQCLQSKGLSPYFFYSSTSHVYRPSDTPITEVDEIAPRNVYGFTKYFGEQILQHCHRGELCIGRIFSFYSKNQQPPFLYPSLLNRFRTEDLGQPFRLPGANSIRDILPAEEVASIVYALLEKKFTGTVNIASGEPTSIAEFARKIAQKPIDIVNVGESDCLLANITKLKNAL